MKKTLLFIMIALASASAQADMALKFLGTADANDLSQLAQDLMADTGIAVSGDFGCFELPVFDLESGNPVGIGVDCLNIFDGDDSGAMIEAITFFFLPRGTLVNHGCTSVRPFWAGVGDSGVTHMTGSIGPAELGGNNPRPLERLVRAQAGLCTPRKVCPSFPTGQRVYQVRLISLTRAPVKSPSAACLSFRNEPQGHASTKFRTY